MVFESIPTRGSKPRISAVAPPPKVSAPVEAPLNLAQNPIAGPKVALRVEADGKTHTFTDDSNNADFDDNKLIGTIRTPSCLKDEANQKTFACTYLGGVEVLRVFARPGVKGKPTIPATATTPLIPGIADILPVEEVHYAPATTMTATLSGYFKGTVNIHPETAIVKLENLTIHSDIEIPASCHTVIVGKVTAFRKLVLPDTVKTLIFGMGDERVFEEIKFGCDFVTTLLCGEYVYDPEKGAVEDKDITKFTYCPYLNAADTAAINAALTTQAAQATKNAQISWVTGEPPVEVIEPKLVSQTKAPRNTVLELEYRGFAKGVYDDLRSMPWVRMHLFQVETLTYPCTFICEGFNKVGCVCEGECVCEDAGVIYGAGNRLILHNVEIKFLSQNLKMVALAKTCIINVKLRKIGWNDEPTDEFVVDSTPMLINFKTPMRYIAVIRKSQMPMIRVGGKSVTEHPCIRVIEG